MIQIIAAIILSSLSTFAGVSSVGQGGDVMAIEFKEKAKEILETLKKSTAIPPFSLKTFANVIESSNVESTDEKLYLNGLQKDAINYSDKLSIVFNRTAWSKTAGTPTRSIFVLHELLGLMKIEDRRYDVSSEVIKKLFPGSVTCFSILTQMNNEPDIVHTEVLQSKNERVETHWKTQGYAVGIYFNPNSSASKVSLGVTLDELAQDKGHMFKGAINPLNPYFNIFIDLGKKGPFSFIEIQCEYN